MAIAGRVAIVPKGEWSQSVTYDKLDLVTRNGNTFIAYKSSVGVEPVDGDTWMLVMQGIDPQDIENIIDGTTPVGDTLKLGGKGASEYVVLANALASGLFSEQCKTVSVGVNITVQELFAKTTVTFFTNWTDATNFPEAYGSGVLIPCVDTSESRILYLVGNKLYNGKPKYADSTWSTLWSGPLATTADLANYFPKTGGTVTTDSSNQLPQLPMVFKNGVNANGSVNRFEDTKGSLGHLGFVDINVPIFSDINGSVYPLLHTGNKPTGTYNGNGSATSRTINIGGIGKTLCIRRKGRVVFADSDGALCIDDEVGVTYFEPTVMNFTNGTLTIATDDSKINHSGWTYTYTLL